MWAVLVAAGLAMCYRALGASGLALASICMATRFAFQAASLSMTRAGDRAAAARMRRDYDAEANISRVMGRVAPSEGMSVLIRLSGPSRRPNEWAARIEVLGAASDARDHLKAGPRLVIAPGLYPWEATALAPPDGHDSEGGWQFVVPLDQLAALAGGCRLELNGEPITLGRREREVFRGVLVAAREVGTGDL